MTIYLCPKCSGIMRAPEEQVLSGRGTLPTRYTCSKCGYTDTPLNLARGEAGLPNP